MGFFSGVKSTWRKSEAAVVIQNLLEHQHKVGMFDPDPGRTANALIQAIWDSSPETFDGRRGVRPHKATIAAAALLVPIRAAVEEDAVNPNVLVMAVCLAQILTEIEQKGHLYDLNNLDDFILSSVMGEFEALQPRLESEVSETMEFMAKLGM